MNADDFNTRLDIAEAAVEVYNRQPDDFFIHDIARELGTDSDTIYTYFDNRWDILDFFYSSLITRYRVMTGDIEDYGNFTLAEKLSNFCYTTMKMLGEERDFVASTYHPFVLYRKTKSPFQEEVEGLFYDFVTDDALTGTIQRTISNYGGYTLMAHEYLQLIDLWLEDESEHAGRTQALADKWARFNEELFYVKVFDSGLDMLKYMAQNRMIRTGVSLLDVLLSRPKGPNQ